MKSKIIFLLITGFIVVGGATFLTLTNKGSSSVASDQNEINAKNGISDQSNNLKNKEGYPTENNSTTKMSTAKNSYDTDDDGEYENEDDDDNNSAIQNPVVQTPAVKTTPKTPASTVTSYTLAQVATHNSQTDCWTVVNSGVYNITSYITRHPGGVRAISSICGKDGTSTFENQHGGQSRPENTLASFFVGNLK